MSATALLERLIIQGVDTIDHPGIVSRVPTGDRRAALATGPDRWEIVRGCVSSSAATFSGAAAWHLR